MHLFFLPFYLYTICISKSEGRYSGKILSFFVNEVVCEKSVQDFRNIPILYTHIYISLHLKSKHGELRDTGQKDKQCSEALIAFCMKTISMNKFEFILLPHSKSEAK